MHIVQTSILAEKQLVDIRHLVEQCKKEEHLSISFPEEEGLIYFLLYHDHTLIAGLSLFFPCPELCECIAMTSPKHRKKGFFSDLLEHAFDYLEQHELTTNRETIFYFVVDDTVPSATYTLNALEASYEYSEYLMQKDLTDLSEEPSDYLNIVHQNDSCLCLMDGKAIGSCRLSKQRQSVYLFDFEISLAYRKKGYGTQFLQQILLSTKENGCNAVLLQVSGKNIPALSLYKKTGFQIIETLSYYHYS